jgi:hypothetical protein
MAQHSADLSVRKNQTESGAAKGWVPLKEAHSELETGLASSWGWQSEFENRLVLRMGCHLGRSIRKVVN